jgi:hypothetical protein
MLFPNAISADEIDGAERVPDYQCETCGASLPSPGECDACLEKLEECLLNNSDPRRI